MGTFILKKKLYTMYDETDTLKRMKDSDILAEKERKTGGWGGVALKTATGAALGAGVGTVGVGAAKSIVSNPGFKNRAGSLFNGIKSGGKWGAIGGATIAGLSALNARHKIKKENEFYNDRLENAQRHALRRERADWKSNMTNREGYSY